MVDARAEPARADGPAKGFDVAAAAFLGALGFLLGCIVVDRLARAGVYGRPDGVLWVRPYFDPASAIIAGWVPYRDWAIEYPPFSLPVFVLPAILGSAEDYLRYRTTFEVLISVVGAAVVPVVLATLVRIGATLREIALVALAMAVSPLVLGPLVIARYDLWPALLTAGAVWAVAAERRRLGFLLLGLGVVAKVYPLFLFPVFAIEAWRARGTREALFGTAIVAAVGLVVVGPFVVASPSGALDPFLRSVARPLQVESLAASVLVLLHEFGRLPLAIPDLTFGSYNLEGDVARRFATIQSVAMFAGLAAVWVAAARGAMDRRRFVLAVAATLLVEVALGKVFSPQYVIWLVPAVAVLIPGMGYRPLVLLAVVVGLTSFYYPARYTDFIYYQDGVAAIAVFARNVLLCVFALEMAVALWRDGEPLESGTAEPEAA